MSSVIYTIQAILDIV